MTNLLALLIPAAIIALLVPWGTLTVPTRSLIRRGKR
jgi:hypothetical protein